MYLTDAQLDFVARATHQVNKQYCMTHGDDSQPDWEDAPEWQKQSARNGVIFLLDNPHSPISASHESWMKEKEENGWVYGPVKDPEKKEHPCMVPYDDLPEHQKFKDLLFRLSFVNGLTTLME